jgi:glyoxylase-like metal-dependent hydrolase (beta-lactamase superfamily II)
LPQQKILFSGDLVEYGATAYAGDAYFGDWPKTLDKVEALGAVAIVPGRGAALTNPAMCREGIATTRSFLSELFASVQSGVAQGHDLKRVYSDTEARLRPKYGHQFIYEHCMPFDISRAFDEATAHRDPRVWTAERDRDMWAALQA